MKKTTASLVFIFSILLSTASPARTITDPILTKHQRDVMNYFAEVALGFEYGSASGITRKWKVPMKIYIEGHASTVVLAELNLVIDELNDLFTDGFSISLTEQKDSSNFVIFFGSRNEFASHYPADTETVKRSSGIFRIFWNKTNYIHRGYAFIHTATSETEQRHAVREELTQSLGLGKDSALYVESIFQSEWTIPTAFAEIDREIIRCLYHPAMQVGLTKEEVDPILAGMITSGGSAL